jgi:hypothetical protein
VAKAHPPVTVTPELNAAMMTFAAMLLAEALRLVERDLALPRPQEDTP